MDHDRQGSLLTPSLREYLDPDTDSDVKEGSAHERTVRKRLRTRLRAGFRDFRLLLDGLGERDRQQMFGPEGSVESGYFKWDEDARQSAQAIFGFLYRCYYVRDMEPIDGGDGHFRYELARGVEKALKREYPDKTPWAKAQIDKGLLEERQAEAIRKYREGEPMGINEILALFDKGQTAEDIPSKFIVRPSESASDGD